MKHSLIFLLLCSVISMPCFGARRKTRHKQYVPSSILIGSPESRLRQNEMARQDGLKIIENDRELAQLIRDGILVPLPDKIIKIDRRLDKSMRHCTPWTRDFLLEYGKLSQDLFKRNLKVNSAVRTVDFQVHLRRTNGNAAEADGSLASSHLTGATIDIAKKGMPLKQLLWMREQLEKLELLGLLEATEEMHQAVFHVMVFKIYSEGGK